jgi:5-methylcytosine-specific restriction endonuclease McrA
MEALPIDPPVSKRLRFRILVRDRFTCRYCGARASDGAKLAVDHVKPRSKGGKTEATNLITACEPCNSGKSDIDVWNEESES